MDIPDPSRKERKILCLDSSNKGIETVEQQKCDRVAAKVNGGKSRDGGLKVDHSHRWIGQSTASQIPA